MASNFLLVNSCEKVRCGRSFDRDEIIEVVQREALIRVYDDQKKENNKRCRYAHCTEYVLYKALDIFVFRLWISLSRPKWRRF